MPYRLEFLAAARKEWDKLGDTIRSQFVKKLRQRLERPRIPAAAMVMPHHYKIKLKRVGYRLVYRVADQTVTVTVVAVGRRERNEVYNDAKRRRGTALTAARRTRPGSGQIDRFFVSPADLTLTVSI